jgi:hypothetical protein
MLDPCQFDPRMEVKLPRIHGPIVIHLESQTNLQTNFLAEATNLPAKQPPLGAIKHRWMERWWDGRSADAPYVGRCPLPLHRLISAYKYPYPLHTIKEAVVLGGDHHSSIPAMQALKSSSYDFCYHICSQLFCFLPQRTS